MRLSRANNIPKVVANKKSTHIAYAHISGRSVCLQFCRVLFFMFASKLNGSSCEKGECVSVGFSSKINAVEYIQNFWVLFTSYGIRFNISDR